MADFGRIPSLELDIAPVSLRMFIDGGWSDAESGDRIDSINPATGRVWATFPAASATDVDRAVRAAYRAMHEGPWSTMTATQRGHLLR